MKLFLYVQKFLLKDKKIPWELKQLASGTAYLLHELPGLKFSFMEKGMTYLLQSHHISLHKHTKQDKASLSEYHCTASFKTTENTLFKLHVNFNSQDQLELIRFFDTANNLDISLNPTNQAMLIELAEKKARDCISLCRKKLNSKLGEDTNKLEKKIAELKKSISPSMSKPILDEIINQCTEILSYNHAPRYVSKQHLYRIMKRSLEQSTALPSVVTEVIEEDAQDRPIEESAKLVAIKKEKPTLIKELDEAKQAYTQCELLFQKSKNRQGNPPVPELLDAMKRSLKLINDLMILIQGDDYIVSNEAERDITILQINTHELRDKLLIDLLLGEQFVVVKALIGQQMLELSEMELSQVVQKALFRGSPSLLRFVLEHSEFPIHTTTFDGVSTVDYCLNNAQGKSKEAAECYDILTQQDKQQRPSIQWKRNHKLWKDLLIEVSAALAKQKTLDAAEYQKLDAFRQELDAFRPKLDEVRQQLDTYRQELDPESADAEAISQAIEAKSQEVDAEYRKSDAQYQRLSSEYQRLDAASQKLDTAFQNIEQLLKKSTDLSSGSSTIRLFSSTLSKKRNDLSRKNPELEEPSQLNLT